MTAGAFGVGPRQKHARERLDRLAGNPPQALILEGGTAEERAALALYLTARLNCRASDAPCGLCPTCLQIKENVFLDLLYFDGAVESIKVDPMREVRRTVGEPPRGEGTRVVVLAEAQALTEEAANALLKTMEEPRPGNVFVLLAPQRERLFPTLVSRSWVLTLAWPSPEAAPEGTGTEDDPAPLLAALLDFWRTGRGWFGAGKTRPPKLLADRLVAALGRALAEALSGAPTSEAGDFLASRGDPERLRRLDLLLAETQEALNLNVNPALALDRLATAAYGWFRG